MPCSFYTTPTWSIGPPDAFRLCTPDTAAPCTRLVVGSLLAARAAARPNAVLALPDMIDQNLAKIFAAVTLLWRATPPLGPASHTGAVRSGLRFSSHEVPDCTTIVCVLVSETIRTEFIGLHSMTWYNTPKLQTLKVTIMHARLYHIHGCLDNILSGRVDSKEISIDGAFSS